MRAYLRASGVLDPRDSYFSDQPLQLGRQNLSVPAGL